MNYTDYNFSLAARFVSDFNLPITIIRNPDVFQYELRFFEPYYGSLTKWIKTVDTINAEFNGDPQKFLDAYAEARNNAITYIETNEKFLIWNSDTCALQSWRRIQYPKSKYANVYNQDTVGRQFTSFDMKNANFQALKYAGVLDDNSYADFLHRFTEGGLWEYMKESKYTRQVLFGKCNANRQITLEKKLMAELYDKIKDKLPYKTEMAYFGADEFVLLNKERVSTDIIPELQNIVDDATKEPIKLDIRVEMYDIEGWAFHTVHGDGSRHILGTFYHKSCDNESKYKCMPANYSKILLKLLKGEEPNDNDKTVNFDKCMAVILDEITIEKLPKVGDAD